MFPVLPGTDLCLRPPRAGDEPAVRRMIETVLAGYGMGYDQDPADNELDDLPGAYSHPGECFYVLEAGDGRILGTGGLRRLSGEVAEIHKMYFLPEIRGRGYGKKLMALLLTHARRHGYRRVTLETNRALVEACRLYEKFGFAASEQPLGLCNCDLRYDLTLSATPETGNAQCNKSAVS